MPLQATSLLAAAGANRHSHAADSDPSSGLIAFGAGVLVALWQSNIPHSKGIHETLHGHAADVSVVRFATTPTHTASSASSSRLAIASGDVAGNVIRWEESEKGQWKATHKIAAPTPSKGTAPRSVSAISMIGNLLVVGSADGAVRMWSIEPEQAALVQTISIAPKLPLDLELFEHPAASAQTSPHLFMAMACTDRKLHLWVRSDDSPSTSSYPQFTRILQLDGHRDWIRSLSVTSAPSISFDSGPNQDILIATGSQDNYIRIWRIARVKTDSRADTGGLDDGDLLDLLDKDAPATTGPVGDGAEERDGLLALSSDFKLPGIGLFQCTCTSVLFGHEHWVTGLSWSPIARAASSTPRPPSLLSVSADNSMVIWSPDTASTSSTSGYLPSNRFGQLASSGTASLGYFGALWTDVDGRRTVLAHNHTGSWLLWRTKLNDDAGSDMSEWEQEVGIGGHTEEVGEAQWEPNGRWIATASQDKTSRIFAPCPRLPPSSPGTSSATSETESSSPPYREVSRPQIHGYPLRSLAFISPLRYASAGDEKTARVFEAPLNFLEDAEEVGVELTAEERSGRAGGGKARSARLPPLALSNRAVDESENGPPRPSVTDSGIGSEVEPETDVESEDAKARRKDRNGRPPLDEELSEATLWPEIEKLYGHGWELVSLAVSSPFATSDSTSAQAIATSCKATDAAHAVIRLHDAQTWRAVGQPLSGHSLTVTALRFSKDAKWLLSVSRDRALNVYRRVKVTAAEDAEAPQYSFVPALSQPKAHARIIWDAAWSEDARYFVTASRDKLVTVWPLDRKADSEDYCLVEPKSINCGEAVTAVAVARRGQFDVLAVGFESGKIAIRIASVEDCRAWSEAQELSSSLSHASSVTSLAWRPERADETRLVLASSGEDGFVRVTKLSMEM